MRRLTMALMSFALAACGGAQDESSNQASHDELSGVEQAATGDYNDRWKASPPHGGWVTIRNTPSGFVIGNMATGWSMYRNDKHLAGNYNWYWNGGYIHGDFNQAGWVRYQDMYRYSETAHNWMGSASTSMSNIGSRFSCPSGACTGPNSTYTKYSCGSWLNVNRYSGSVTEALNGRRNHAGNLAAGQLVGWRYITPDGYHAMVFVHGADCPCDAEDHYGAWRFIPSDCIDYPSNGTQCVVDRYNNCIYW